ncbi:MAG: hypothetical protein JJU36_04875 [Phycisphaeraceae bacterium]|nr:hypothetical protein [Phycisphaeraceae bacterium]
MKSGTRYIVRGLVTWLVLLILMVLLAGIRQGLIEPALTELKAHQVGTVLAMLLAMIVVIAMSHWMGRAPWLLRWRMGLIWVVMTVIFEIIMVRILMGRPWSVVMDQYRIDQGRLWLLLLATLLIAPVVAPWLSRLFLGRRG